MADLDVAALARELSGHVHQAAKIAGQQRVAHRSRRRSPVFFSTMELEISRVLHRECAAEAAADLVLVHLDSFSPSTLASSSRGWRLTPSSRRPEQLS